MKGEIEWRKVRKPETLEIMVKIMHLGVTLPGLGSWRSTPGCVSMETT